VSDRPLNEQFDEALKEEKLESLCDVLEDWVLLEARAGAAAAIFNGRLPPAEHVGEVAVRFRPEGKPHRFEFPDLVHRQWSSPAEHDLQQLVVLLIRAVNTFNRKRAAHEQIAELHFDLAGEGHVIQFDRRFPSQGA
jgi:hypothetical protein